MKLKLKTDHCACYNPEISFGNSLIAYNFIKQLVKIMLQKFAAINYSLKN